MGLPKCNTTLEYESIDEDFLVGSMTFHDVGLIISAVFGIWAIVFSFYLIAQHATHYYKPSEQRHIIRIVFMIPVYAMVSFLSYYYYRHAIYYQVMRDCYEAFAIASFFTLLCNYIANNVHDQKDYFRQITPKTWIWPLPWMQKCCGGEHGIWRTPRSGLTWFNYCFFRVAMTMVAVFTQIGGRYCQESISPAFAYIWVASIECICVIIAMYCLIQFYHQLRQDLSGKSPLLKLISIKLVIFLSFWQSIILSFLASSGAIKPSKKSAQPDITIGISSMILIMEMAVFSVLHLWAFDWRPYDVNSAALEGPDQTLGIVPNKVYYQGGRFGIKAIGQAFNPWDLMKAVGRGARWFFVGRKKRYADSSYQISRVGTKLPLATNSGSGSETPSIGSGLNVAGAPFRPGRYYQASDYDGAVTQTNHFKDPPPAYVAPPAKSALRLESIE